MWKSINYEVSGRSHEQSGIPCQDKTSSISRNGVNVIALADGAGSASHSHIGAQLATAVASNYITDHFDSLHETGNGAVAKRMIHTVIKEALTEEACERDCEYKELASTLQLVAVKDNRYLIIQIGDGVIGYLKNGEVKVVSKPDQGEFANMTIFLTSNQALSAMKLFKGELDRISGFVLMSDGTSASFYNKRDHLMAPVIKDFIEWTSTYSHSEMLAFIKNSFNDMIRMNTNDDCSIAIMTKLPEADFFSLPLDEKCQRLGIDQNKCRHVFQQVKRYEQILAYLREPRTFHEVARHLRVKEKHTINKLNHLLKLKVITKEGYTYTFRG